MGSLILTIKLKGAVKGPQKHVDKQVVSVDVSLLGSKSPDIMTRKILHTDLVESDCVRKMRLSSEIVDEFQSGECPYWEKPHFWKTMSKKQRLESHLKRYDEGYGFSYDFLESK